MKIRIIGVGLTALFPAGLAIHFGASVEDACALALWIVVIWVSDFVWRAKRRDILSFTSGLTFMWLIPLVWAFLSGNWLQWLAGVILFLGWLLTVLGYVSRHPRQTETKRNFRVVGQNYN